METQQAFHPHFLQGVQGSRLHPGEFTGVSAAGEAKEGTQKKKVK